MFRWKREGGKDSRVIRKFKKRSRHRRQIHETLEKRNLLAATLSLTPESIEELPGSYSAPLNQAPYASKLTASYSLDPGVNKTAKVEIFGDSNAYQSPEADADPNAIFDDEYVAFEITLTPPPGGGGGPGGPGGPGGGGLGGPGGPIQGEPTADFFIYADNDADVLDEHLRIQITILGTSDPNGNPYTATDTLIIEDDDALTGDLAIFNGNGDFEAITITPQSLAAADDVTIADAAGMVFITSDSEDTTRPVIRNEFTVPAGKTTPESLDITVYAATPDYDSAGVMQGIGWQIEGSALIELDLPVDTGLFSTGGSTTARLALQPDLEGLLDTTAFQRSGDGNSGIVDLKVVIEPTFPSGTLAEDQFGGWIGHHTHFVRDAGDGG
ncbi:MAG: hypothetical protein AAF958_10465, partial [Planctomycetota bacterium]